MTDASYWPFVIYAGAVLLTVGLMLALSYVLGERHSQRVTGEPYESGISPTGSAELRIPAQFYLIAMFFVIFDLEAAFLFIWAVAVPETGWLGFGEMAVFVGILLVALFYLWRIGALEWGPDFRKIDARQRMARAVIKKVTGNRGGTSAVEQEAHALAAHEGDRT